MNIIHDTDSLPSNVGGVSDYYYKLSYELAEIMTLIFIL
jgi:hypothetical protein